MQHFVAGCTVQRELFNTNALRFSSGSYTKLLARIQVGWHLDGRTDGRREIGDSACETIAFTSSEGLSVPST